MSINIECLWKDRKRHLGLPLSFTRYSLSDDRLFVSEGFLNIKDDEVLLYRVRDIDTEISPMVGDEKQSRDLIDRLTGEDPEKLWQSNIFGKSVYDMIQEGLTAKLVQLPEEVRVKFRSTLTRIVNEGATGLICLIL